MLAASPDLTALARSQIVLLTQGLGAVSSVMYLTEEIGNRTPNLIEVVAYPDDAAERLSTNLQGGNLQLLLPSTQKATEGSALIKQGRIVLPLIYQDTIVGFLMTGREDREWSEQEQLQIQQVANTLAIACALDRRCQWLEESQRQAYTQQANFLSTLLHQLRNPLTAMRTFAQLLLRRILPEDPNQKFVQSLLREAAHMQELLAEVDRLQPTPMLESYSDLLLLPSTTIELSAIDPMEILEPLINSATAIAQERDLDFTINLPDELPLVLGNAAALREVLGNLIDNAMKYTIAPGSVSLNIEVDRNYATVNVQDTGLGIPTNDLPHLFKRNFRGRQAEGEITGTGLGLAIALDLVQKMQGEILVSSQENQGSTFSVRLKRWKR
ncbi:MAG: GAF domain-containing sensor histidine kinase [Pseudanabaena sp. CRU_2_10]|nr:GAF domain-containing sensor histidine kinase [Pseudanabaena sp. CRU_2_10]